MYNKTNVFHSTLEQASLDDEAKAILREEYDLLDRESKRSQFRLTRTMKDKAIMINLLNKTIGDLQDNQEQLEDANKELLRKNKEIALKNMELTQQKEMLERQSIQLENNFRKLEMSYAELEQFSYVASHDLKSPLRAISSYAQLLRRRYSGQLDDNADSFIDFIVQGVFTMDNILSDLLEYSRTGKEMTFQKVSLNQLFDTAKSNIQYEITQKEAQIECSPLPEMFVIKTGIIQLFQNLVGNSIKFTKGKKPVILVDSQQENENTWHISVEDNGIGLKKEYADKVFQPFQRITPQEFPGTGMGLAICKKIVQMHNGQIWYEPSARLGGTAFHFTLSQRTT